jgi:hypothetical protein
LVINKVNGKRLSRRDFLKFAAATAVTVPAVAGAGLLYTSRGDSPKHHGIEKDDQVPPIGSPGHQPILLLLNGRSNNPFGVYIAEILLAEGINCFQVATLSDLDSENLIEWDIVILGDGPLSQEQAGRFSHYVLSGGNLIAMNPDEALLPLLGLKAQETSSYQNYVVTNGKHELADGLASVAIQYHGDAKAYHTDGAQAVAWLSDKSGALREHLAVSINHYGEGWACAWAYDLARSVVLTRQGNPAWADQEWDGFDGVRPSDMFHGWLDLDRIEIPQADEQQRLLINVLHFMSRHSRPLPRLWYFPGDAKSMFIATSDAHQNPGWAMERVIQHVEKFDGFISIYSLPPFYAVPYRAAQKVRWWLEDLSVMDKAYFPSPSRVTSWRERGHEFGIHPLINNGFEESWQTSWRQFTGVGYGPVSPTTRVHRILWDGWMESAKLQERYGFGMNLDYYHVGHAFRKQDGEWVYGHFTGSGLPMKFIDEHGRIINLYQQVTQLADDHLLNLHWGGLVKLPAEEAVEVSKSLMDRSRNGGYAAIGAIFHTDPFAAGEVWAAEEGKWMDGTLQHAAENNIPIWSAEMWLNFTQSRHDTIIESIHWNVDDKKLNFTVRVRDLGFGRIRLLLPVEHSNSVLSGVEINDQLVGYDLHSIGSTSYAGIILPAETANIVAYFK